MGNSAKQQLEIRLLEGLPSYVHADCCDEKHFLTLNRDIHGNWSIGYTEFEGGTGIEGLCFNDSSTVKEAAIRMSYALGRWKRRNNAKTK